jgi:elongation factor Ts
MAQISAQLVKQLRDKTGIGMGDCKKALEETGGDVEKAEEWLRKKGIQSVVAKGSRVAAQGAVGSYVHLGGKIGVLCEVNCESDFVARGEAFQAFVKDICMHVAAAAPMYLKREDVPAALVAKEKEIHRAALVEENKNSEKKKPEAMFDKIVEGKINKWYGEICLLEQPWVREPKMTVEELRAQIVQKTGENVQVRRFVRFVLGEGIEVKKENLAEEIAKMTAAVKQ